MASRNGPHRGRRLGEALRARATSCRRRSRSLVLAVLVVGLVVAWGRSDTLRQQLSLSLVRQPTPFTELYLLGPHTSPPIVAPAQLPREFAFVIVNHEGADRVYRYLVTDDVAGTAALAEGSVAIPAEGNRTVEFTFTPPQPQRRYHLDVGLVGRPERLHFEVRS